MSVTIEYNQVRTVVEGPKYRVASLVTYAVNIAKEIFVFDVELGEFQHVATVWDMENVLNNRDAARLAGNKWYRAKECTVEYEAQTSAIEFVDYTEDRIQDLATQYARATGEFEGNINYHIENAP